MSRKEKKYGNDLDDLLDKAFEIQDKIHYKCKIRDNPKEKQKKWKEKYGKK